MPIVDDIQELVRRRRWIPSSISSTTLFRNGKRIILASDRPVELGYARPFAHPFLLWSGGELEKPNIQLCVDILSNKIRRDGLKIPVDVISFIAQTRNGSVRICREPSMVFWHSIVYNSSIDIRLAERVIKRAVKVDDKPLTIDDIVETVLPSL